MRLFVLAPLLVAGMFWAGTSAANAAAPSATTTLAEGHPLAWTLWILAFSGLGLLALAVAIISMSRKKKRKQGSRH